MKTLISSLIMLLLTVTLSAQDVQRATTNGAVRLFGDKDDLTSVITIIPDGTTVEVISTDSIYTYVNYDSNKGYVKSNRLKAEAPVVTTTANNQTRFTPTQPVEYTSAYQPNDRYSVLVARYGEDIGKRLYQHKVWKGVTADMARDSWGKPKQINKMYVDQNVDEEWVYSKKFLYFRDGILIEWGPVK